MYLSEMELLKARLSAMGRLSESRVLEEILLSDENSEEKKKMREGERYFRCEHDILREDFRRKPVSETPEGEGEVLRNFYNPNRSNHHCVNPFHHTLVAQKAAYLVGREPTITVKGDGKTFAAELEGFCDEEMNCTLYQWVVGAANKGVEYLHVYYDEDGSLDYCIVPAEEMIVFYDEVHQKEMVEAIRYYTITVLEEGRERLRRKVEWWTKEDVTYYTENDKGVFYRERKLPHWQVSQTEGEAESVCVPHGWGRVPFIPLRNNSRQMTDLELVKGLIDAYDYISSEGTNNLLDLVDLYWVIQGYGGETAGAIAKKLQINKAVQISDTSGRVEAKQVALPMEGRLSWMKALRKDIFHFGMGVDTDSENWGKAPSGVALQFQYAMFYLKINEIVPEIRKAVKEFLRFVTEDWNRRDNGARNWKDIQVLLNTSGITDDLETVQMIRESEGLVSEKTLLGRHPFVEDVNREMAQLEEERKEKKHEKGNVDGNRSGGRRNDGQNRRDAGGTGREQSTAGGKKPETDGGKSGGGKRTAGSEKNSGGGKNGSGSGRQKREGHPGAGGSGRNGI